MALIRWLGSQVDHSPREADRKAPPADSEPSPAKDSVSRSKVTTNIPVGSLVLAGPQGLVRLTWTKGQREHYLPAGDYRIRNLRIVEKQGKKVWFTSSTQPKGKAIRIDTGSPLKLRLNREIQFGGRAFWKKNELSLGFALRDAQGRGLSIYRKGSRVPIRYEILSSKGKVLQAGKMNYG